MFSLLRHAPRTAQPVQIRARRGIAHSLSRSSELSPEPPSQEELNAASSSNDALVPSRGFEEEKRNPDTFREFLDEIGSKFKKAQPRHWLGGEVPFPMNPSFKPPPPLSDAVRTKIYREFMHNPKKNSVRDLSQRYHISMKRVDAILRLKGMEAAWIKGKQRQTGFLQGMEKLLGVKLDEHALSPGDTDWARYDVHEADTLQEEENRDAARQRYERQYWEAVPEDGSEPVIPASLERAKALAKDFAARAEQAKSDPLLMPKVPNSKTITSPRARVQVVTKPGRPAIKFVDVGGKFIDVEDRLHRLAAGDRRSTMKRRKEDEDPQS